MCHHPHLVVGAGGAQVLFGCDRRGEPQCRIRAGVLPLRVCACRVSSMCCKCALSAVTAISTKRCLPSLCGGRADFKHFLYARFKRLYFNVTQPACARLCGIHPSVRQVILHQLSVRASISPNHCPPFCAVFWQVSATFAASMVISPAVGSVIQSFYGNDTVGSSDSPSRTMLWLWLWLWLC